MIYKIIFSFALVWGSLQAGHKDNSEIWLISQEFVKLGKKESYEEAKKEWLDRLSRFAGTAAPTIMGVDDPTSNQYIYLIPLEKFGDIDKFTQQLAAFEASLPSKKRLALAELLNSFLNYKIDTIQAYKAACSYLPQEEAKSPFVYFHVYSLVSGGGELFEKRLAKRAVDAAKAKLTSSWRVWQVLYGSELPKYVVCFFGKSLEEAETHFQEAKLVTSEMNDIVRNEREGKAILRPELSLNP